MRHLDPTPDARGPSATKKAPERQRMMAPGSTTPDGIAGATTIDDAKTHPTRAGTPLLV